MFVSRWEDPAEKENSVRHRGELPERRQERTSGGVTFAGTVRSRWERGYKGSRAGEVWGGGCGGSVLTVSMCLEKSK